MQNNRKLVFSPAADRILLSDRDERYRAREMLKITGRETVPDWDKNAERAEC